ncbi:amidase signature domain-containing protein [Hyaloraphidium curvatum]|nr:amidase signature domain-containing protein [Hyaloraphidium curvatum]
MPSGDASSENAALRQAQLDKIPAAWRVAAADVEKAGPHPLKAVEAALSPRERELTELTAVKAVELMVAGKLKSEELVTAICHRAALAHAYTNCLTEIFFDEAIARAKQIDADFAASGKPLGRMHGLPVSLKDDNNLPGKLTTWGLSAWSRKPVENYGAVPQVLMDEGAVFYAKTNVPQCLMTWESDNPVWGKVLGSLNTRVAAGGSSGGEGALVGLRGSLLGVGSDIGGSIRLPSGMNGIYGLKPSARRFPYAGSASLLIGIPDAIAPVKGPMANSIEDLELYSRVVCGPRSAALDPDCLPFPYADVKLPAKLKFGYFTTNGLIQPVAPVVRAVEEAVAAIKAAGHEVVEWKPPSTEKLFAYSLFDFGAYMGQFLDLMKAGGDSLVPGMNWIEGGPHDAVRSAYDKKPIGLDEVWAGTVDRETVKAEYLAAMEKAGIDGIIAPVSAIPAAPHFKSGELFGAISYTIQFNVTDLSAGVVPVTAVTLADKNTPPTSFANTMEEAVHKAYSPELYEGTPVGVQVVGRRLEEEKVIEMMKVVDAAVKKAKK